MKHIYSIMFLVVLMATSVAPVMAQSQVSATPTTQTQPTTTTISPEVAAQIEATVAKIQAAQAQAQQLEIQNNCLRAADGMLAQGQAGDPRKRNLDVDVHCTADSTEATIKDHNFKDSNNSGGGVVAGVGPVVYTSVPGVYSGSFILVGGVFYDWNPGFGYRIRGGGYYGGYLNGGERNIIYGGNRGGQYTGTGGVKVNGSSGGNTTYGGSTGTGIAASRGGGATNGTFSGGRR